MKKRIKKFGGSHIIVISREDLELYGWKLGDILEIEATKLKNDTEEVN